MNQSVSPLFELVLPCYNEEKSLNAMVARAIDAARKHGLTSEEFKLVLVENGSKDNSRAVLAELESDAKFGPWLKVVRIDLNQGYGYGILQGLRATTSEVISWSHADQQCDPDDAFRAFELLKQSSKNNLLIKGTRIGRSFKEAFVSRIFELIATLLLGKVFFEVNAQPKVFRRSLLNTLTHPPYDFAFDLYVLYSSMKSGYQIETLKVNFPPRVHGFSNWAHGLKNRARNIRNMIIYIWKLSRTEGRL